METKLVTAPTTLPIVTYDLNYYLRLDGAEHDVFLGDFIKAATEQAEAFMSRRLITQTWDMVCRSWDDLLKYKNGALRTMPYGKTQSITHIKYLDADGVEQTVLADDYTLMFSGTDGAYLVFGSGYNFPALHEAAGTVTARFVCGYGLAADVPEAIKAAIRLICGDLFDGKDNTRAIESLMAPYRLFNF